jgi:hypothetical protein
MIKETTADRFGGFGPIRLRQCRSGSMGLDTQGGFGLPNVEIHHAVSQSA